MSGVPIDKIELGVPVFDCDFHRTSDIIAVAAVNGTLTFHTYNVENGDVDEIHEHAHDTSVRSLAFSPNDNLIYGGRNGELVVLERSTYGRVGSYSMGDSGVNAVHWVSADVVASGDDAGKIVVADCRQANPIVMTIDDCDDQIFGLQTTSAADTLFAISGDKLSVFDLRRQGKLVAMSDEQEEDLTCLALARNETRLIAGTPSGALGVFTVGDYGDIKERITGFGDSTDSLCKLADDVLLVGCGDGSIHVVSLFPNKICGQLSKHEVTGGCDAQSDAESSAIGVDVLKCDRLNRIVASVAAGDEVVQFHRTDDVPLMVKRARDADATITQPLGVQRNNFFDEL